MAVRINGNIGVAIEVNSETDFVARTEEFRAMVGRIIAVAPGVTDIDALTATEIDGKTVGATLTEAIARVGENLCLRHMASIKAPSVVAYVHNADAYGLGRIAVLVGYSGQNEELAREVGMHIAALNPVAISEQDLDSALLDRAKQVVTKQAEKSGQSDEFIKEVIEGGMKKFLSEVTLLNQPFALDPDHTVGVVARRAGIRITGFARLQVGEGLAAD